MKTTENYEQLLARFTKGRLAQTDLEDKERVSYLKDVKTLSFI